MPIFKSLFRQPDHLGHMTANRLLQSVLGVEVIDQRQTVLHAIRQKAGMFAAAVVVPLIKDQFGRRCDAELRKHRHMAAALQRLVSQPGSVQHALDLRNMFVLAVVAGTQQRHLLRGKTKVLRPTARHKRQCLQRLEGRAREGQPVGVARPGQQGAAGIDDRDGAEMTTLQCRTPTRLDQRYQFHRHDCDGFRFLLKPARPG